MQKISFIYAIAAAITWGLAYTLDQKALEQISPASLIIVNALLAIGIFLPFTLWNGEFTLMLNLNKETYTLILVSQLLAILASFLILAAIKGLGASAASVFEIMYPVFVILFSFFLYGDRLNGIFWVGSSLIFLGSMILIKFA